MHKNSKISVKSELKIQFARLIRLLSHQKKENPTGLNKVAENIHEQKNETRSVIKQQILAQQKKKIMPEGLLPCSKNITRQSDELLKSL